MSRILAALALTFGLAACDVGEFPIDGPGGTVDGGGGVAPLAFNGQISQDFTAGGCTACHGATPVGNDFQIITYQTTIVAVDTGNPAGSSLVTEMDPNAAPRAEHVAAANAIRSQLYLSWITAGAPENDPAGGL